MPDFLDNAVEAERRRRSRTERALEALGEGTDSKPKPKAPPPKPPAKPPEEKIGMGQAAHDSVEDARIAMLRRKLAAVSDPKAKQKLADQIRAIQEQLKADAAKE